VKEGDMKKALAAIPLTLLVAFSSRGLIDAQTAPPTSAQTTTASAGGQSRVLGEVVAIDLVAKRLTLKTTSGEQVVIECDEKTVYKRVPPGETTLDKAITISLTDITVGDRVVARGSVSGESKVMLTRGLVVISQNELTQKKERERAEWLRRGIEGVVSAVKPETGEVTLLIRTPEGSRPLIIETGGSNIRRYAPDSIRFSDAKSSSVAEVKAGDRFRALGDKSSDGARFKAEEIIFGSFRTVGGFITAVDASSGEIKINDIPTKQSLTIAVTRDSMLRRLSPELVKQLAAVPGGGGAGEGARGGGTELQQVIERQPAITVADLKVGDGILASSTAGTTPLRVSAIVLTAGVESFLKLYTQNPARRDFNLGLGLPSGITP
jgi:hypothetical protein